MQNRAFFHIYLLYFSDRFVQFVFGLGAFSLEICPLFTAPQLDDAVTQHGGILEFQQLAGLLHLLLQLGDLRRPLRVRQLFGLALRPYVRLSSAVLEISRISRTSLMMVFGTMPWALL